MVAHVELSLQFFMFPRKVSFLNFEIKLLLFSEFYVKMEESLDSWTFAIRKSQRYFWLK